MSEGIHADENKRTSETIFSVSPCLQSATGGRVVQIESITVMEVALSLGSNLGDRLNNLQAARDRISSLANVSLTACAPVYETDPVDVQPEYENIQFLNTVIVINTNLEPVNLIGCLSQIELEIGRVRTADRNAPRPIDIDIIYAGNIILDSEKLRIPHGLWSKRRFVVQPLANVKPELILPGESRTVNQVLNDLPDHPAVELFSADW